MKVLLDIKDNKARFVMELLQNLSFVKAQPLSPYKAEVLENLKQSIEELNLIKDGKLKGIPAKELLNEL
jgi:hypothetical protein